jgi:hypothetical protein
MITKTESGASYTTLSAIRAAEPCAHRYRAFLDARGTAEEVTLADLMLHASAEDRGWVARHKEMKVR